LENFIPKGVPEGHLTITQRFNAGICTSNRISPEGTTDHRAVQSQPAAKRSTFSFVVLLTLLLSFCCYSQSILLTGAKVHTISGNPLSSGQVLIENGKISAVGQSLSAPNAKVIDLQGLQLYPGLIALNTVLGLTEISAVRATLDTTEPGEFTPDVESWIAVNPDSELLPVSRANGIAFFEPVPQGALLPGQSGLVTVEGWTTDERAIKKPLSLHLFWPAMELSITPGRGRGRGAPGAPKSLDEQAKDRRNKVRALADFFEEAGAYRKAKEAAENNKSPSPARVPAWEAMLPYLRGELPITIHADEIRQIKSAVQWAVTNHFKIVLAGARDAAIAADLLASNNIPVIFGDTFTLPTRDFESYDVYFKTPEVLRKAGVKVAFCFGSTTFDAPLVRNLPYSAAQSVAFGLPEIEALKGLTLYPAQIAGVADRLGSIEPGKEATLFAVDGDILDIRAKVTRMWIAGKEISLESRHTRLYDKYKNRPPTR